MELTRETIELLADGSIALDYGDTKIMAKQLLAELDQPKVWTNAPEDATEAEVYFGGSNLVSDTPDVSYTRELPKSRIDEIAEEAASSWAGGKKALEDAIKSAILRALEEKEAER